MASKSGKEEYVPSELMAEMLERYFAGDTSAEVVKAIKYELARDQRFASYFKQLSSAFKGVGNRGMSWSVGTRGSRRSGNSTTHQLGGFSQGVSQWNQQRNYRAGISGAPTSPGGFKSSGRDEDSATRRSGLMSEERTRNAVSFLSKGVSIGGRKYSKSEVDAILKRGLSGATMNWRDQAVYDAVGAYGNTFDAAKANRKAEVRRERLARMAAEEEEKRIRDIDEHNRKTLGIGEGRDLSPAQMKDIREGRATFRDGRFITNEELYKEGVQRTKDAADEYERKMKERSAALKYASDLVKAGTHEWTKEQKDRMRKIQDEIESLNQREDLKDTEKSALRDVLDKKLYDIRTNPMERIEPEETNDENFAKTTRTDERGIVWAKDANGSWKPVYNPKDYEAEDKLAQAEENRRIRAEERAENRRLERNKWVAEQTLKQQAAHEKSRVAAEKAFNDNRENIGKVFTYPDFDELSVRERLFDLYDATDKGGFDDADANVTGYEDDGLFAENGPMPEQVAPEVEQETRNDRTPVDWKDYVDELDSQQDDAAKGICPVCGSALDGWGNCNVCGWPDERMVEEWRLMNESEGNGGEE